MKKNQVKIIEYEEKYKNDMISMVAEARTALGLSAPVRDDLYDVRKHYLDKGDSFWLAIDSYDRVAGCLGYSRIEDNQEAFLHRFYVKASMKRQGIGTMLLQTAEREMKSRGISVSRVHLGGPEDQWFESYAFYPKHGYIEYETRYMYKEL